MYVTNALDDNVSQYDVGFGGLLAAKAPATEARATLRSESRSARTAATIVIVKDAIPDDAQDFSFTAGGGLSPTSFSLDDDADGTLSNTQTFTDVAPGCGYSRDGDRAERLGPDSSATCDDGSPVSNINVAAGRDRHLHVHEPQARARSWSSRTPTPDDPQDFTLHRGRRPQPGELLARRRRGRHAVQHADASTTSPPGSGYSLSETVPSGWDQTGATCDDGSPVTEHRPSVAGRDRDLHVHQPQARPDRRRQGRAAQRRRRTSPSRPAAASARRASRSTTTPTARSPTRRRSRTSRRAPATRVSRDRARAAGTSASARPATTAARSRTSTSPPARSSRARSPTSKRGTHHRRQGRAARRPAGLLASRPAAASARPASRSTTTPTATLSNTRTFSERAAGRGYSLSETVPSRLGPDRAPPATTAARSRTSTSRPAETVTCTFTNRKRGHDHRRQGRAAQRRRRTSRFTAGGGLSPGELPARRRRRRHAVQHAHVHRRRARLGLLDLRDRARRLGPGRRHLRRRQPGLATSTSRPARPSPARSRTASAARSSSSRTPCPTTRRTSRSRRAAASARGASRSTTTPTARCRTRARSTTSAGAGTPSRPSRPAGRRGDLRRRQPGVEHRVARARPSPARSPTASAARSRCSRTTRAGRRRIAFTPAAACRRRHPRRRCRAPARGRCLRPVARNRADRLGGRPAPDGEGPGH